MSGSNTSSCDVLVTCFKVRKIVFGNNLDEYLSRLPRSSTNLYFGWQKKYILILIYFIALFDMIHFTGVHTVMMAQGWSNNARYMPVNKDDPPFRWRCDDNTKSVIQFSDSVTLVTESQIMTPLVDCDFPLYTVCVAELHGSAASKSVISFKLPWFLGCSWNLNFSAKEGFKYSYIKCVCVYNFTVRPN